MYLNTQSGLTPALDALGSGIAARQRNDSQLATLVNAHILPETDRPQGSFLSRLLGGAFGGGAPTQAAPPAMTGTPQGTAPGAPMPQATSEPATKPSAQPGLPTFAAAPGQGGISSNASTALAYFRDKGLPEIGANGLVGGFTRESGPGLDPHAVNPNGGATGIAQWLGSRKAGLMNFAASGGRDPNDLRTQLDYVWSELQGPERATLNALMKAGNPMAATAAALGFERPEGWTSGNPMGAKDFDKRLAATVRLGGGNPTYGGGGAVLDTTPTASVQGGAAQPAAPAAPAASPSRVGETIQALIRDPTMRDIGVKLWEQNATGKNFNFHVTAAGDVIRTNDRAGTADVIYRAPVKREHVDMNGRALSFDPQSGTYTDATPAGLPQGFRPATPQERGAYGVQDGAPFFIGPDGKPGTLNSGTNVNVNSAADPMRKAVGDRFDKSLQAADTAAKMIPDIQTARQQLRAGIISGAGANPMLSLQKVGAALGVTDPTKIQNTETFRAAVGPIVLKLVKNLGSASSITDADREFAEKMAGGSIQLDAGSINRILDLQERAANATIAQHNDFVRQLQSTPAGAAAFKDIGAGMRVEAPAAAPGQPVQVGSPDEAMRLPPGTRFIDPNGQMRVRP